MKKVNWNIKVPSEFDELVDEYIINLKLAKHIYLKRTQLVMLAVADYLKRNPVEED